MSSFALLLAGQAAALPQTPSSLSGTWEGIQTLDQVGDCVLAGASSRRLQVAIVVEPTAGCGSSRPARSRTGSAG